MNIQEIFSVFFNFPEKKVINREKILQVTKRRPWVVLCILEIFCAQIGLDGLFFFCSPTGLSISLMYCTYTHMHLHAI